MKLEDFDYALPPELIAQAPTRARSASRLLHLDGVTGALHDLAFAQLPELIRPQDVVVLNDTRVIKARLLGKRKTGGRVEVLIERVLAPNEALAQLRASHPPRAGETILLHDTVGATVLARHEGFFHLEFECHDIFQMLEQHGEVPLPPYVEHAPDADDEARYQTVYARAPGAVAAPTAGLHFDTAMLDALRERNVTLAYVTLHVGAGTFQPVRADNPAEHDMHSEWYDVPQTTIDTIQAAKASGGRVVSVGTTTLRALETCAAQGFRAGAGETRLFILPGYRFQAVDRLITNFHLPKSTLLMLVAAFAGLENIRRAYAHAIAQRYRFYSYGDAMLIEKA